MTTNPEDEALLKESQTWPLDRRVSHGNWRVRSNAFDFVVDQTGIADHTSDRATLEQATGLDASACLQLLASSVGDQNANVMDKALDAFFAYLDVFGTIVVFVEGQSPGSSFGSAAEACMKQLTTKCLKASKRTTLVKSIGVCGALVEVDQGMAVIQGLVHGGFSHKVPKAVAAALEAALEIVRGFYGTGEYDQRRMEDEVKVLLGGIDAAKLYAHRDAAVRSRVKDIVVALMGTSKRMEAAVRGMLLEKLPDAMQKEVLDGFAKSGDGGMNQGEKLYTKLVQKKQRELAAAAEAAGEDTYPNDVEMMDVDERTGVEGSGGGGDDLGAGQDVDPYEFAKPVNIMPSLQKAKIKVAPDEDEVAFWDCFSSKKWNVRKAAVELVRDAVSKAVRLDPHQPEYTSLVREFKVILTKDANIHCAAAVAMASESMAKALRSDFASNAKVLCPDVLGRFKEKNPVMSKAAESCLQTFATFCYSLKDVSDDIAAALSQKNPKMLTDTLRYLTSLVGQESKRDAALCKDSLAAAVKLLADADARVRQEAQSAVVAFAVAMGGFPAIKPMLNGVDEKRKEAVEKACATASSAGVADGRSVAQKQKISQKTEQGPMVQKPSAMTKPGSSRPVATRTATAPPRRPEDAKAQRIPPSVGPTSSGTLSEHGVSIAMFAENTVSKEAAEEFLTRVFGPELVENLRSSLWQERVEAMTRIFEDADRVFASREGSELLLSLWHLPGWTDKNFQVLNKMFEVGAKAAELSQRGEFGRQHASCIVQGAVEKIHELKHRVQASTALTASCERVGPKYVASLVHQRAAWHKNPKVLAESLVWMQKTIEQFGYNNIDSKGSIVAWMKDDLSSTDPNVKSKALALLGECHSQVGAGPFQSLMDSLKPALAASLQETFDKKPVDASYQPSLTVNSSGPSDPEDMSGMDKSVSDRVGASEGGVGGVGGVGNASWEAEAMIDQERVIERVDVSKSLGESLVAQLVSTNWKERNAAVESVEEVLAAAKHVTAEVPVEFLGALRKRFSDSNRNLAARSISLVGTLAEAVGPDFDRIAHATLLGPAVENLADMKKQVREAVISMLDAWGQTCPKDRLFPALIDAVSNPKGASEGKVMALKWMVDNYEPNSKCREFALKAAAAGAKDKTAPVRSMASQLEKITEGAPVSVTDKGGSRPKPGVPSTSMSAPRKSSTPTRMEQNARTPAARAAPKSTAKSAVKPAVRSGANRQTGNDRYGSVAAQGTGPAGDDGSLSLSMGQGKGSRGRQYRQRPGGFEPPSSGDRAKLRELLAPVASRSLIAKMFSQDFQDHVDALDALSEAVPGQMNEILTSLDLILQWIVLILCEQNTQSSLRALDLLSVVLEHLADDGYRLSDMEASILLPAIIEKCGQNQDYLRSAYRRILVLSASVYNPAKVVDFIVSGLSTKNSRSKVECCSAISDIVLQNGGRCVTSAKNKPVVALSQLVSERDSTLRTAAITALESIHESVDWEKFEVMLSKARDGDREVVEGKLHKLEGKLKLQGDELKCTAASGDVPVVEHRVVEHRIGSNQNQGTSYLESHQKSYPEPMHVDPVPAEPAEARTELVPRRLDMSSEVHTQTESNVHTDVQPLDQLKSAASESTPVARSISTTYPIAEPPAGANPSGIHTPVPVELKSTPGMSVDGEIAQHKIDDREFEQRWERNIELMYSADLARGIDATKHVCSDIMMLTSKDGPPPSARILAVLANTADKFVLAVCAQLEIIFSDAARQVAEGGDPPSSRGCKFALNALLQGLGIEDLAMAIPQGTLRTAISLLLCSLVDEHGLLYFEQGPTLVRAVNVLIAKMLDATNKNYAFAALLHLLRSPPTKSLAEDDVPKFNDLVVKCLIKLTKGLSDSKDVTVDISFVLLCLHDYFMFLGVEEIRKRSAAEDKPLRMVKTILHQICKLVGYNVYQYTTGIPGRHTQPQPIIFRYIDINLKMLKEMNQLPTDQNDVRGVPVTASSATAYATSTMSHHPMSHHPTAPVLSQHGDDEEVRIKLKDILSRVTSKDRDIKGVAMRELLDVKRSHPRMVDKYLQATQERFRTYIEESLEREMNGEGGLSGPMSGPTSGPMSGPMSGIDKLGSPALPSSDNLAERLARLRQRK